MDSAIEIRDEQQPTLPQDPIENPPEAPTSPSKEVVLTIRKKIFALGPVYEVVRNDNVVVASIKSKRVKWFQQERYVFELADV